MAVLAMSCFVDQSVTPDTDDGASGSSASDGGSEVDDDDVDAGPGSAAEASDSATDPSASGSDDDASASGVTGEDGCDVGARCFDLAPPEWAGPVRWASASSGTTSCREDEAAVDEMLHADVVPGELECNCECSLPHDACLHEIFVYALSGGVPCSGAPGTAMGDGYVCYNTNDSGYVRMNAWEGGNPACTPSSRPSQLGPSTWERDALPCAAIDPPACADGVCLPAADDVCIFRHGEHPCPSDWPTRELWYADLDEARECDCACGEPSPADCDGELWVYDDASCDGDPVATLDLEVCEGGELVGGEDNFLYVPNDFGECTPSSAIDGEVRPTSPVTTCCAA